MHNKSWLDNRHERHCPAWYRRLLRSCRCQHSCVVQKRESSTGVDSTTLFALVGASARVAAPRAIAAPRFKISATARPEMIQPLGLDSRLLRLRFCVMPLPGSKRHNKSVEVNGRGGLCRSFHVVSFISGEAKWRCPPVPHLLRSQNPFWRGSPRSGFPGGCL